MQRLSDIHQAEAKVLDDIKEFFRVVRTLSEDTESLQEGAIRLRYIRSALYENLNQMETRVPQFNLAA